MHREGLDYAPKGKNILEIIREVRLGMEDKGFNAKVRLFINLVEGWML